MRAAILLALGLLLAGCAAPPGNGRTSGTAADPRTGTVDVQMRNASFLPMLLTVRAGTTVVWHNADRAHHTVTAEDRAWSLGIVTPGGSVQRTFAQPGDYAYACAFHGDRGMQAKVRVVA
jgi:plastocyanin